MAFIGTLFAKLTADNKGYIMAMNQAQNKNEKMAKSVTNTSALIKKGLIAIGGAAALYIGIRGVTSLARSFLQASNEAESYGVRLKILLGSQKKANMLFKQAADFAGKVPFAFNEIMKASTTLAGVVQGGPEAIAAWLPVIGDLAATTGLTMEETTGQMIRMMSAGAGAADLFRDRGVLAMLGFTAGVKMSAEETTKKVLEEWNKVGSKFRGATTELAKTLPGKISMIGDAWFKISKTMGDVVAKSPGVHGALVLVTSELNLMADAAEKVDKINTSMITDFLEIMEVGSKIGVIISAAFNGIRAVISGVIVLIGKTVGAILEMGIATFEMANAFGTFDAAIDVMKDMKTANKTFTDVAIEQTGKYVDSVMNIGASWDESSERYERYRTKVQEGAAAFIEGQKDKSGPEIEGGGLNAEAVKAAEEATERRRRVELRVAADIEKAMTDTHNAQMKRIGMEEGAQRRFWEWKAGAAVATAEAEKKAALEATELQKTAIVELGAASSLRYEQEQELIMAKAEALVAAGEDQLTVQAWVNKQLMTLEEEHQAARLELTGSGYEQMSMQVQDWAENAMTTWEDVGNMITGVMGAAIKGVGNAVAQAIVYGKSLSMMMKSVFKQVLSSVISFLVQSGVQAVISSLIQIGAAAAETSAKMAGLTAVTFAGVVASHAYLGHGAITLAASVTGAMLTASATAGAAGAGVGKAVVATAAHGGMDFVPKESTFQLDEGERVLSPEQNEDLTESIEEGNSGGGGDRGGDVYFDGDKVGKWIERGVRHGDIVLGEVG